MKWLDRVKSLWNGTAPRAWDPAWSIHETGRWGEDWAAYHYFSERGAAILARNWRTSGGELDLVVREMETLVFVEVKTRAPGDEDPMIQVRDAKRQSHFRRAASAYLARLPRPRPRVRFDALIVVPDPQKPERPAIQHHANVLLVRSESEAIA